jgi:hypothetical protein
MSNLIFSAILDTQPAFTSNSACYEVHVESFAFSTDSQNLEVDFYITAPFTVHRMSAGSSNGAFRVYLDGDAMAGKQWNGLLLCNGGAWAFQSGLPTDGRFSVATRKTIANHGNHTIYVMYSGSDTVTIGTLRSRRIYQVIAVS